jgi:hypothetical protein
MFTPLVEQRDYDEYTMSLAPDPGQQRRLLPQALMKRSLLSLRLLSPPPIMFSHPLSPRSKLRYLYYEALGDLFPTQWGTLESNLAIAAFIIAFWLRMYLHYIIQYLFLQVSLSLSLSASDSLSLCVCLYPPLQIFSIPVYDFQVRVYEIMFKYMSGTIPVAVEFGVVAIGPIANLGAFIIFVLLSVLAYEVNSSPL